MPIVRNLMAMIQAKVEGKQIVETVETKHKAPVVIFWKRSR